MIYLLLRRHAFHWKSENCHFRKENEKHARVKIYGKKNKYYNFYKRKEEKYDYMKGVK